MTCPDPGSRSSARCPASRPEPWWHPPPAPDARAAFVCGVPLRFPDEARNNLFLARLRQTPLLPVAAREELPLAHIDDHRGSAGRVRHRCPHHAGLGGPLQPGSGRGCRRRPGRHHQRALAPDPPHASRGTPLHASALPPPQVAARRSCHTGTGRWFTPARRYAPQLSGRAWTPSGSPTGDTEFNRGVGSDPS